MDNVTQIADTYHTPSRDTTTGSSCATLRPRPFTFVRHPGMGGTDNRSERILRPVVLHRKIRLMFRTPQWA